MAGILVLFVQLMISFIMRMDALCTFVRLS